MQWDDFFPYTPLAYCIIIRFILTSILAINVGLAIDEIEEPNCFSASSSSFDNSSSVSQEMTILQFHYQISLLAEPCRTQMIQNTQENKYPKFENT